jgi:two-component system cell cycle response regulator
MMPGIDGFEVTRRIRQNPATAEIPIILVTALSGDADKTQGLEAGADEFLSKPVHRAELAARVGSMLRLKRFQEQLRGRQRSEIQVAVPGEAERRQPAPAPMPTILVVEDNDKDALLLLRQLEHEPYFIKRVANGEAAIRAALNVQIDVMILDIMLPGMDGFEVCRRVKSDDQLNNIQIVMLTSLRDLDCRIQGTEVGADDYLVKPVDQRELNARVQALVKKKRYIDKLQNRYETALNRAICDDMTGLYNHGYFKRFLEVEIKRSQRQDHPISLLLLDLDNFKVVNDRLGHLAGDRILIQVAQKLKESIREIDFAARYGGEEFAVILPYAGITEAREVAERIRNAITTVVASSGRAAESLPVSASIGVSICPDDGADVQTLLRRADEVMYLAKRCGKNKVCVTSDLGG